MISLRFGRFELLVVGAIAVASCVGAEDSDDDDSSSCQSDSDCKGARICVESECVEPGSSGSGGSGPSGGSPSTGGRPTMTGGSSNTGGAGPSGGSGPDSGGSGPDSGGASDGGSGADGGDTGEGGDGTGGSNTCTSSSPARCPSSSTMELCVEGMYEPFACSTACASIGFATGPCVVGTGCDCGAPTNAVCENGAQAYCTCATTRLCTDPRILDLYVSCHTNDPMSSPAGAYVRCLGQAWNGTTAGCTAALSRCTSMEGGGGY